jgi:hypothetical protein
MKARHVVGAAIVTVALSHPAGARAQATDSAAQADALFNQAMALRSAGNDAAACPKFLASKQLAPAVGVSLYLADCYERIGRNASAWKEFREGEKVARARGDKRADVAAQRATALEPTLGRLTVSASPQVKPGTEVSVDGATLSREYLGSALAVDPGDHVVTVASAGQPARTFVAHVDASHPTAVVSVGEPDAASPPAAAPVPATVDTTPAEPAAPTDHRLGGRVAGIALMVVGAAGVGIGTWLVTDKTTLMPDGQICEPHLRPHAIPEAAVAFSVGGVALISGAVLFYVNRAGRREVALRPAVIPGGGGAIVTGSF